jgi:hypothetical protein
MKTQKQQRFIDFWPVDTNTTFIELHFIFSQKYNCL